MTPEENNRAPERIYWWNDYTMGAAVDDTILPRRYGKDPEAIYIRSDLYAALEAENARLTAERDAWQEQASGLATQLTACEAEARHARLVEALNSIANGDGVYGQQAGEYKQIARAALQEDEK